MNTDESHEIIRVTRVSNIVNTEKAFVDTRLSSHRFCLITRSKIDFVQRREKIVYAKNIMFGEQML